MSTNTEHLSLKKPSQDEFYNIDDFNNNADLIDAFAGVMNAHKANKSNPHGVTPAQIGALPTNEVNVNQNDMNAILKQGRHLAIYNTNSNTIGTPFHEGVTNLAACQILSYANGVDYGCQIAFMAGSIPFMRTLRKGGIISAWSMGYLPLTGGTLTGDLRLNVDDYSFSLLQELKTGVKMQIGSYVGTGTVGRENRNQLSFNFFPKYVHIVEPLSTNTTMPQPFFYGMAYASHNISNKQSQPINLTWDLFEPKVSWYVDTTSASWADAQLNKSGIEYCYIAIG